MIWETHLSSSKSVCPLVTFPVCRSSSMNVLKTSICHMLIFDKQTHVKNEIYLPWPEHYLDILFPFFRSIN